MVYVIRRLVCQNGATHQPHRICDIASWLANTHICVGLVPEGDF